MILITIHLPPKENSHLEDVSVCNSFHGTVLLLASFPLFSRRGRGGRDRHTDRDTERVTETETDFPKLLTGDLEN